MTNGAVERYRVYLRGGPKHGRCVYVDAPLPLEVTVDDALYLLSSRVLDVTSDGTSDWTEYAYSGGSPKL